ncbi:MAG: glycosyltransferase [Acidiferrobacterales bacterium]
MNILHLMSQTHLTGPEVYVASLCKRQLRDGHRCIIVSDSLTVQTLARHIVMSIHNRSPLSRVRNIIKLTRLCKRAHIDLIHAHSRAASWLANIVRLLVPVAYVSTVHGRQSVHASSKRFNVYGKRIITVCEHLADHLRGELNIKDAEIKVVRNAID